MGCDYKSWLPWGQRIIVPKGANDTFGGISVGFRGAVSGWKGLINDPTNCWSFNFDAFPLLRWWSPTMRQVQSSSESIVYNRVAIIWENTRLCGQTLDTFTHCGVRVWLAPSLIGAFGQILNYDPLSDSDWQNPRRCYCFTLCSDFFAFFNRKYNFGYLFLID